MSNTHLSLLVRSATVAFLLTGIMLLMSAGARLTTAQLSGHGTTLLQLHTHPAATEGPTIAAAQLSTVVIPAGDPAQTQLLIGMLLVLAGIFAHGFYVVRFERRGGRMGKAQTQRRKLYTRKFGRAFSLRSMM